MASEGEYSREADKIWENGWWWFCRERKAETRGGNRNTIRRDTPPRAIWEMYDEEKKVRKEE